MRQLELQEVDTDASKLPLTEMANIGPTRARHLHNAGFETPEEVLDASVDELQRVATIGRQSAEEILDETPRDTAGSDRDTRQLELIESAKQGGTNCEIVARTDVSRSTLYNWLDRDPSFAWEYRLAKPKEERIYRNRSGASRFAKSHADKLTGLPAGADHPNWKGGRRDEIAYGKGWNKNKKRAVRKRDQARCRLCGRTEPEHLEKHGTKHVVHHIRPARSVDDEEERNAKANLLTVCRGVCHRAVEDMAPLVPDLDL